MKSLLPYSVNLVSMQQGIKKLQWFEYLKVVFLKILNAELCQVFANQVTYRLFTTNDVWGWQEQL